MGKDAGPFLPGVVLGQNPHSRDWSQELPVAMVTVLVLVLVGAGLLLLPAPFAWGQREPQL